MKLQKNIGTPDRWLRGLIGVALLGYAYWKSSWVIFAFGIFTLFEALASWCILYQILGKSSCPTKKR